MAPPSDQCVEPLPPLKPFRVAIPRNPTGAANWPVKRRCVDAATTKRALSNNHCKPWPQKLPRKHYDMSTREKKKMQEVSVPVCDPRKVTAWDRKTRAPAAKPLGPEVVAVAQPVASKPREPPRSSSVASMASRLTPGRTEKTFLQLFQARLLYHAPTPDLSVGATDSSCGINGLSIMEPCQHIKAPHPWNLL